MDYLEAFQNISSNIWVYGGSFVLVLSVLVFIHEFGHYFVARMCGVRVENFSIGFGPELFGINDSHGTRWRFSAIPLGGYVKMYGDTDPASAMHDDVEDIPEANRHEAFFSKPVLQRALIVFAGPAINYLYALIVMGMVFAFMGQPVTPPYASAVIAGSAADRAGFQPLDEVVSIDGKDIRSFEDIRHAVLVGLDTRRTFTVKRGDDVVELVASPDQQSETDKYGFSNSRGFLGITSAQHAIVLKNISAIDGVDVDSIDQVREIVQAKMEQGLTFSVRVDGDRTFYVHPLMEQNPDFQTQSHLVLANGKFSKVIHYSPLESFVQAGVETYNISVGTLRAISQIVVGQRSAKELGGLIRIGAMAGDVAQQGALALLMFSALLSINLGLINLFPIPVLDGGHLVFYAVEAVLGKPVPEKAQDYAFRAGFVFLICVMAFANINDVVQLFL